MDDELGGIEFTHWSGRSALGRDADSYSVWCLAANGWVLDKRLPRTPSGWFKAWSRYSALESVPPTALTGPSLRRPPQIPNLSPALIAVGVVIGVIGLFPTYLHGASLASEPDQLADHVILLAAWAGAALSMVAFKSAVSRIAIVFATGVSLLATGFYLGDVAEVASTGSHIAGAGFVVVMLGLFICAEGCAVGVYQLHQSSSLGKKSARPLKSVVFAIAIGIGVAATFAPAWDRYVLSALATGQTSTVSAGNAFASPWPVIVANVVVIALIILVSVVAAYWKPVRLGAALLAGSAVPLVAQFVAAAIQIGTVPPSTYFGVSPAQASQARLQISSGFTPDFYLFCVFVALFGLVSFSMFWQTRGGRDGELDPASGLS